mmetsp:Transcript_11540/g.25616  ORF Transcript_11540/g.25616 Transcript_11540/m.25616 type:complete len:113 (+) Transcript_11540:69-407(+)
MLNDAGFEALLGGLVSKKLQELDLRLDDTLITDKSGIALGKFLRSCGRMTTITLSLENTRIADPSAQSIANSLVVLPLLTMIVLYFNGTLVSRECVSAVKLKLQRPGLEINY